MVAEGTLTGKFADFTASNSSHVYNQLMEAAVTMFLSYHTNCVYRASLLILVVLCTVVKWICWVIKFEFDYDICHWNLHVMSILRQFFGCSRASHTCRRLAYINWLQNLLLQSNSPANTTAPRLIRDKLHMKLETATNIKLLMDWTERWKNSKKVKNLSS